VIAIIMGNSMNLIDIVNAQKDMWFAVVQPAGALVFMIVTLAEVNRAPFDMPEAEQELTAGYHAEYSGMKFALFFMAEYQKMIVICMIAATLFFGGYREFWFLKDTIFSVDRFWFLGPVYMLLKVIVLLFFMIWVRATWPRIRYDRLMAFGWKVLLPLSLALAFITAVGILLQQLYPLVIPLWIFNIPVYITIIPFLSIAVALVAVAFIYRDLRRKSHGRV
jgi:NADH-quinone oxidoreductase subunit H